MSGSKRSEWQSPKTLHEIIREICKRPAMFTGSHDFTHAAAYIEGYWHACAEFNPEALGPVKERSFHLWLALKLNMPRNVAWSFNLQRVYSDDEVIFEKLPMLYDEYLNSGEWCDWDIYIAATKNTIKKEKA